METSGTLYKVLDDIRATPGGVLVAAILNAQVKAGADYATHGTHVLWKQSGVWWYHD